MLLEQQGGSTTATYAYGNALTRKDGETPLFDGQGSERTVTNSGGAVQATLTLSAFGQAVASSGSSTSAYQYAATSRYRSDGDAGLALVGCRYYDAQAGGFISRDTYLDQKPYAYCDGDPVNLVDPDGHDPAPPAPTTPAPTTPAPGAPSTPKKPAPVGPVTITITIPPPGPPKTIQGPPTVGIIYKNGPVQGTLTLSPTGPVLRGLTVSVNLPSQHLF